MKICDECGKQFGGADYYMGQKVDKCPYCTTLELKKNREMLEKKRYNDAKKYTLDTCPAESKIMLYSSVYGYNNGFFSVIEDLEDYCDGEEIDMPKYIYGTIETRPSIDAERIIEEYILEDGYEDIDDVFKFKDYKDLQNLLDGWLEKFSSRLYSYWRDCTTIIELEGK